MSKGSRSFFVRFLIWISIYELSQTVKQDIKTGTAWENSSAVPVITYVNDSGNLKMCIRDRFLFSGVEKKKFAGCTVTGMCGKVDSVGKRSSAI